MRPIQSFWLECIESDLPSGETWLSDAEIACVSERWVPKRRRDWLLGRWTAKCALARYFGMELNQETFRRYSILPTQSGAPVGLLNRQSIGASLSISHRDGRALAVIGSGQASLGCDLEIAEAHSRAFIEQFFTPSEIEQLERSNLGAGSSLETLIWSAKESVLKVLTVGLRVDTRSISVFIGDVAESDVGGWQQFSAVGEDGRRFGGWWHRYSTWFRTIAGSCPMSTPVALSLTTHPGGGSP